MTPMSGLLLDALPFPPCRIPIILASKSPRRIELMQQAGLQFTVCVAGEVDEIYPTELQRDEIPLYLANLKADAFLQAYDIDTEIVVAADTIVWHNGQVLGKPVDRNDAIRMLQQLSGSVHDVFTGVCLATRSGRHLFSDDTKVFFRELSIQEINHYVDGYQPYDKAGAYGIQEWIGLVGIEKIIGSYFNVVGLPIQKLYSEIHKFIS